jgi:hypothetical protein
MLVDGRGGVLRPGCGADGPARVVADQGAEKELDSPAVGCRVTGDTFERVDTPDADIDVLAAQLVRGPGESLGDLAFPTDADLSPSCDGADDNQQPAEALQDGRSGVIGQLGLGLLELDTRLDTEDPSGT